MASNFYMGVINVFLLYYYTDVWGIEPAAAFMFLITKVIDAVSDSLHGTHRRPDQKSVGTLSTLLVVGGHPHRTAGLLAVSWTRPVTRRQTGVRICFLHARHAGLHRYQRTVPALGGHFSCGRGANQGHPFRFIFASLGTLLVAPPPNPWSTTWAVATRSWVFD